MNDARSSIIKSRFAPLRLDKVFKLILYNKSSIHLLKGILEMILPDIDISEIELKENEHYGLSKNARSTSFDLYCRSEKEKKYFLIELQFKTQNNLSNRLVYYSTFPIVDSISDNSLKAKQDNTEFDYQFDTIYVVSITYFYLTDPKIRTHIRDGLISDFWICNKLDNSDPLTDKVNYVTVELPRLNIGKDEPHKCQTPLQKLAFTLLYSDKLSERPVNFNEPFFIDLYHGMEIAALPLETIKSIEMNIIEDLDHLAYTSQARAKGRKEGREEGIEENTRKIASRMIGMGMTKEIILQATDITSETYEEILRSQSKVQ